MSLSLGIVENMSYFECDDCGKRHSIFSESSNTLLERFGLKTLATLPLAPRYTSIQQKPLQEFGSDLLGLAEQLHRSVGMRRANRADNTVVSTKGSQIEITFPGGESCTLAAADVRAACRCAACVNEFTGQPILDPATLPQDIHAKQIDTLGNYAVSILWSDTHASGIFTYKHLEELCQETAAK